MTKDNEISLTEEIEANTRNMEKKANYIPDRINQQAYDHLEADKNRAQEIGMHANWEPEHPNNIPN